MEKRVIQRTCIACRTMQDKREMVRIVRTPEGKVMLDHQGRANGRGAYLCKSAACVKIALRKNQLQRALGVAIPVEVEAELLKLVGENDQA